MFTELMRPYAFDQLFALGDQLERQFARRAWVNQPPAAATSPVDIRTEDDGWRIRVAVPGVAPEDVDVFVSGVQLHIRASDRDGNTSRTRYEQTITVPDTVDTSQIQAACRHGLLEVWLPMKEAIRPRRIQVSSDSAKQLNA